MLKVVLHTCRLPLFIWTVVPSWTVVGELSKVFSYIIFPPLAWTGRLWSERCNRIALLLQLIWTKSYISLYIDMVPLYMTHHLWNSCSLPVMGIAKQERVLCLSSGRILRHGRHWDDLPGYTRFSLQLQAPIFRIQSKRWPLATCVCSEMV